MPPRSGATLNVFRTASWPASPIGTDAQPERARMNAMAARSFAMELHPLLQRAAVAELALHVDGVTLRASDGVALGGRCRGDEDRSGIRVTLKVDGEEPDLEVVLSDRRL